MRLRFAAILSLLLLAAPLLAACAARASQPPLRVVATLAPLADWARQVGQERVVVTQIVPVDVDPETYAPSDADVAAVREADVLISNGLGLEPWLLDLVAQAQPRGIVALEIAQFIGPRPRRVPPPPAEAPNLDDETGADAPRPRARANVIQPIIHSPYLWLDPGPGMAQVAVTLIGDTFTRVDPDHVTFYRRNAERYNGELENLDGWVRRRLATWPRVTAGRRNIAALQAPDRSWHYFAERYGLDLRSTADLSTRYPVLPDSTPLFVDAFDSEPAQPVVDTARKPDGVLRPLGHASYAQLIRENVQILTRGAHRAARNLDRPWMNRSDES